MSDSPHPNHTGVFLSDGVRFIAWDDLPVATQDKILEGTMTDEDWKAIPEKRVVEDVVSSMLNHPSTTASPHHVHVWRKEYNTCMIKGCGKPKDSYA